MARQASHGPYHRTPQTKRLVAPPGGFFRERPAKKKQHNSCANRPESSHFEPQIRPLEFLPSETVDCKLSTVDIFTMTADFHFAASLVYDDFAPKERS